MTTLLPYASFLKTAECLDHTTLSKQRSFCKKLVIALAGDFDNKHEKPISIKAYRMWKGHVPALIFFAECLCQEYYSRGFKDSLFGWFFTHPERNNPIVMPSWIGNDEIHASHRSALLSKEPEWYGKFGWAEPNNLPFKWPKSERKM